MAQSNDSTDLTGKLLIAMPGMGDPRFERSVIYMCAYSSEAAMGLIVNKPAPKLTLDDLLKQMGIPVSQNSGKVRVHFGGPVEQARGFVLHSGNYTSSDTTLKVDDDFAMTATQEILENMAEGKGPDAAILALGYAGWGAGQLEDELVRNGWLVADASPDIVFNDKSQDKWSAALKSLGIDPVTLSATAGRA